MSKFKVLAKMDIIHGEERIPAGTTIAVIESDLPQTKRCTCARLAQRLLRPRMKPRSLREKRRRTAIKTTPKARASNIPRFQLTTVHEF